MIAQEQQLAEELHEAYVYGANQVGWNMERVDFSDMKQENQAMMRAMAQRLRQNPNVDVEVEKDE